MCQHGATKTEMKSTFSTAQGCNVGRTPSSCHHYLPVNSHYTSSSSSAKLSNVLGILHIAENLKDFGSSGLEVSYPYLAQVLLFPNFSLPSL